MSVLFNGTTGYLRHAGRIIQSFPYTKICFGTRASSTGTQAWMGQSNEANDSRILMQHGGSSDSKIGAATSNSGFSSSAVKNTAPHTSSTIMRPFAVVHHSATSATVYFGDSTSFVTTTGNSGFDDINTHTATFVGGYIRGGTAAQGFTNGSLAEAHWYNVALSQESIQEIFGLVKKPDEVTGWVDGLTLENYQASGTYTTMTGTRTFTAVGGVSASAVAHPIDRTVPGTTISCTVGNAVAAGSTAVVTTTGVTTITCGVGNAAAGGSTAAVNTFLVSDIIINNTGSIRASQAVSYTWWPAGRIGSMVGITPADYTGTTGTDGRLVTSILKAAGILQVAKRNASAVDDDVYYEAFP